MKINKLLSFLSLSLITLTSVNAQTLTGGNVFLKGKHIEVGIAPNQSYGSNVAAPAGYHPRGSGTNLGFVADPALDGWDVGTPNYIGCYFLPGVPQEGWDMSINGTWYKAYRNDGPTSFIPGGTTFTGSNVSVFTEGTRVGGVWEGHINNLDIKTVTSFDTNEVFFVVDVTIRNTGTTTLTDIYYSRTLDPDNESVVPGGGGPTTVNTIVHQPNLVTGDYRALVSAVGQNFPALSYLGLGAVDCRAKAYILNSGLYPSTGPHNIESGEGTPFWTGKDYTRTSDIAVGIIFDLGDLAPGDSTTFTYTYILSEDDLDAAFGSLTSGFNIDGVLVPAFGDTVEYIICRGADSLTVEIAGGAAFEWGEWVPSEGLANPMGRANRIAMPAGPIVYRVIGTTPVCPVSDTIYLKIVPIGDTTVINAEICAGEIYDFNGEPKYASGTYYQVYKTVFDDCDSVTRLNLIVNPKPGVDIQTSNNNICDNEEALFTITNPTPNTTYQWLRDGMPIAGATGVSYLAPPIAGQYRVAGVTDKGCTDTSRAILLTVSPSATVDIVSVDYGKVCIGDTITLAVDPLPNYDYYWTPEKAFRYTTGSRAPEVKAIMHEDVNTIQVTGRNRYGCEATDQVTIIAIPCCEVMLPTAFSPNDDGLNDNFNILLQAGQKVVSFQIFNRQGNLVYDNNSAKGWNGKKLNSGEPLEQGVYFYRIIYTCTDGSNYETKGDVTLVR